MLDTMTVTKVLGAFCGALLIFLLGGWAGEALYHTGGGHGGSEQAYLIETDGGDAPTEDEEEVDFAALVTDAEISAGERVWGKCRACHKLDGTDGTGPHLNGVVGRQIAAVDGFAYSDVLAGMSGDAWTPENLNGFLENPKGWAPGTKMGFAGLRDVEERAELVAYLQSTDS